VEGWVKAPFANGDGVEPPWRVAGPKGFGGLAPHSLYGLGGSAGAPNGLLAAGSVKGLVDQTPTPVGMMTDPVIRPSVGRPSSSSTVSGRHLSPATWLAYTRHSVRTFDTDSSSGVCRRPFSWWRRSKSRRHWLSGCSQQCKRVVRWGQDVTFWKIAVCIGRFSSVCLSG
jgi:hypothetical protein